jgi:hypothetical protein
MSKQYIQLTSEERDIIAILWAQGKKSGEIGILGTLLATLQRLFSEAVKIQ